MSADRWQCPNLAPDEHPDTHPLSFNYPTWIPEDPTAAGDRATWDPDLAGGPSIEQAWCRECDELVDHVERRPLGRPLS